MRWLESITDSEHESEQTLGNNEGQGGMASCGLWGSRESDIT